MARFIEADQPFQVMTDKIGIYVNEDTTLEISADGNNFSEAGDLTAGTNVICNIPRGLYLTVTGEDATITEP